jgi:hypothetical protein
VGISSNFLSLSESSEGNDKFFSEVLPNLSESLISAVPPTLPGFLLPSYCRESALLMKSALSS